MEVPNTFLKYFSSFCLKTLKINNNKDKKEDLFAKVSKTTTVLGGCCLFVCLSLFYY